MADDLEVMFARLEGRLDTIQQTLAIRLEQTAGDAADAKTAAKAAHHRLDSEGAQLRDEFQAEIRDMQELIGGLRQFQAKLVGLGIGIGAMSGLVSGLVVMLLSQTP